MPMQGPSSKGAPRFKYSYGNAEQGSIMAFEVRMDADKGKPMLDPIWISRDMHAPDPPVVANGVVYALQTGKNATETRSGGKLATPNAVLYAFDAETGQQLYSSDKAIDSFTHFRDRKSTRLNSSHASISSSHTLSLHDALPIYLS